VSVFPSSRRSIVATLALAAVLFAGIATPAVAADDPLTDAFSQEPAVVELAAFPNGVTRLSGANRYATAVEISKAAFDPGVELVLIANGTRFPDALSGAPVAGTFGAPILLVTASGIPEPVKKELGRLKPKLIVVLGGTGVVSDGVLRQLEGYATDGVDRIGAGDRFATSAQIAEIVWAQNPPDVLYVANGMTFPDALAAGPAAGIDQVPLLLVQKNAIPAAIRARLQAIKPKVIAVMGGTGAVSATVFNQLKAIASQGVIRVEGKDRFDTAVNLSSQFWQGVPTSTVFISSGMQFPDALAIAPVAAGVDGPLLLVKRDSIPESVKSELRARAPQRIVIVGGSSAVSAAVQAELKQYIVPAP